jgi:hypothetical protein
MSWRRFEDHKEESKAVKRFLKADHPDVRVGHGKGTAWGWLRVSFTIPPPADCYCSGYDSRGADWTEVRKGELGRCRHCSREWQRVYSEVGRKVMEFTGRSGDYGGNINYDIQFREGDHA